MKLARFLACAAVAALTMGGCTDSISPIDEFPTFYGSWAGGTWVGDAHALLVPGGASGDTLYIEGSNPVHAGSNPVEIIRARILIHGIGTYLLGPGDASLEEIVGGDVVAAKYVTTSTSVGRVEITSYGGPNGLVEGKISFDAETTSPYGSYGSKASLRDAFFSAVVKTVPHS